MHKGRPTQYTSQLGQLICDKIATGNTGLVKLCRGKGLPHLTTVLSWLRDPDKKEFLESYLCAREAQADLLSDEIIEIADETGDAKERATDIASARLRNDARKWKAGKLSPKKYGDKGLAGGKVDDAVQGNVIEWGGKLIPL